MKYLVTFTTFGWDDFTQRQYDRIKGRIGSGSLCVVADETKGPIANLPAENTIRTSEAEITERCGLSALTEQQPFGTKSALWWNLDYLTYRAVSTYPEYDYYLTMDYDACINLDVDALLERVSDRAVDFVAEPIPPSDSWLWVQPHRELYAGRQVHGDLLCVSIMSNKAATYLWQRRRDMAIAYRAGQLPYWPFCEAFCAMETRAGGLRVASLSDFGDTTRFSFRPAYSEKAASSLPHDGFVHPVFDKPRLLRSLIAHHHPFSDLLRPGSAVRTQLNEFPASDYIPLIARESCIRLLRAARPAS